MNESVTTSGSGKRRSATAETSAEAKGTAGQAGGAAANTAATAGRVATTPLAVANEVARELADTARRPDAVLYWGGLVGAVMLGAIEWPVAAAIGIGVAIARGRSGRAATDPVTPAAA